MNVVILAGGYGTRLHEKTHKIPKPMVNIGRKPILLHIVDYYLKFNCRKFIVCSGYKSSYITNYLGKNYKKIDRQTFIYKGAEIKVINTGVKTNTGGRIFAIKEYLEDEFFITYGDGLSNVNLDLVKKVNKKNNTALTLSAGHPSSRFGIIDIKNGRVTDFREKPNLKEWINIGYMFGNLKLLDYLKKDDVFEVDTMNRLINDNQLSAHKHKGEFFPVDNMRDLREINKMYQEKEAFWL